MDIVLQPIGWVHSLENGPSINSPKEDYWGDVISEIRLAGNFSADALAGLEEFSHIEVLFHLHGVEEASVVMGRRHPRGNPDWPVVGILAQRAKARPQSDCGYHLPIAVGGGNGPESQRAGRPERVAGLGH